MKIIKRINSKQTHHKENKFCISLILMMDLYVIMGVQLNYRDYHFMMYVKPLCCVP